MAKKQKISKNDKASIRVKRAGTAADYNFPEIKKLAITLGMPFPDATGSDYWGLLRYVQNTHEKADPNLINLYDDWVDSQLELLGYAKDDPMRSNQLRLGYLSEEARLRQVTNKEKKVKPDGTVKKKHEKDANNLWKGTKKSYTFELTKKNSSLERITRRVIKKFPEANPKSIKQWYRAALRKLEKTK